jgi:predicted flap endonuclease-1-like 5' DNA nuclease
MYRAVILAGLAPDWEKGVRPAGGDEPVAPAVTRFMPLLTGFAWPVMAVISLGTLHLMERETVDSFIPRPTNMTLVATDPALAGRLAELGVRDVQRLAKLLERGDAAERLGISPERRDLLSAQTDLVLLRGIGTENAERLAAVGVNDVEELARTDAGGLESWLRAADPRYEPRPARIRVWIRGAQREIAARRSE